MPDTAAPTQIRDVIVTRVFDAPIQEVWKAWTESERVKRWWGPHGFTVPVAEMDVREGGRSLVSMRASEAMGGFELYNTWTYSKVVPPQRLEFTLSFADRQGNKLDPAKLGLPAGIPLDVPHVITFKSLGERRTEMTVAEHGYTSAQASETSRAGLDQTLDKMAASFEHP